MGNWLRRLRGGLGIGIAWAVVGFGIGVGIELLARGVQAVGLNNPGNGELVATGLLLPSHVGDSVSQGEINLLVSKNSFSPELALDMVVYDTRYLLMPLMVLETGDNFEVGRYRVVDRHG